MFICLTLANDMEALIAVANILMVSIDPADDATTIVGTDGNVYKVKQSMAHVKLCLRAARGGVDTFI